jgi:hypothetical protein
MVLLQLRRCCGIIAAVRRLRSDGRAAAARLPVHATVDTCHLVVTWHVPPCDAGLRPNSPCHAMAAMPIAQSDAMQVFQDVIARYCLV